MAPYKVAIVGTGMVANVGHLPAWLELAPAVEVVGVFNHTLTKAQQTADRHGIPHAYDDCGRMLDELRPDIVSVWHPQRLASRLHRSCPPSRCPRLLRKTRGRQPC